MRLTTNSGFNSRPVGTRLLYQAWSLYILAATSKRSVLGFNEICSAIALTVFAWVDRDCVLFTAVYYDSKALLVSPLSSFASLLSEGFVCLCFRSGADPNGSTVWISQSLSKSPCFIFRSDCLAEGGVMKQRCSVCKLIRMKNTRKQTLFMKTVWLRIWYTMKKTLARERGK